MHLFLKPHEPSLPLRPSPDRSESPIGGSPRDLGVRVSGLASGFEFSGDWRVFGPWQMVFGASSVCRNFPIIGPPRSGCLGFESLSQKPGRRAKRYELNPKAETFKYTTTPNPAKRPGIKSSRLR